MGITQSQIEQKNNNSIARLSEIQYRINHSKLRQSEILFSKNLIKYEEHIENTLEFTKWQQKISSIGTISKQFLFLPKQYNISSENFLGESHKMTLLFDCYPYVLNDQLLNRKYLNKKFEEDEIWYILWALIDSNVKLNSRGYKLGDIRPHNILFNEKGEIKVINSLSWPNQLSNYCKTYFDKTITYLSPQELLILHNARPQQEMGQGTCYNDSFSIGLTLLSIIYVQDLSNLYEDDIVFFGLNHLKLEKLQQNLSNLSYFNSSCNKQLKYSRSLITIINKLCHTNRQKRLSYKKVWQGLHIYNNQIVNFQTFKCITAIDQYFLHLDMRNIDRKQKKIVIEKQINKSSNNQVLADGNKVFYSSQVAKGQNIPSKAEVENIIHKKIISNFNPSYSQKPQSNFITLGANQNNKQYFLSQNNHPNKVVSPNQYTQHVQARESPKSLYKQYQQQKIESTTPFKHISLQQVHSQRITHMKYPNQVSQKSEFSNIIPITSSPNKNYKINIIQSQASNSQKQQLPLQSPINNIKQSIFISQESYPGTNYNEYLTSIQQFKKEYDKNLKIVQTQQKQNDEDKKKRDLRQNFNEKAINDKSIQAESNQNKKINYNNVVKTNIEQKKAKRKTFSSDLDIIQLVNRQLEKSRRMFPIENK